MIVLNTITSINLLLIFFLLFFRKDNAIPNKVLALLLINPAINFVSNINVLTGNLYHYPYIYFFAQVTCFGFAPLVHIYITLLTGRKINYRHPLYLITVLFMLLVVVFAFEFATMAETAKHIYLDGLIHEPYPDQMQLINGLFIVMQQIYFTVSAIQVYKYRRNLPYTLSSFDKTKVKYVILFIILIWLLNIITIFLYTVLPMTQVEYIYLPVVLSIIYSFIFYFGFQYNSIFTEKSYSKFLHDNQHFSTEELNKIVKPSQQLPIEELATIAALIDNHVEQQQRYTDSDYNLQALSEEINHNSIKVSQAINSIKGKNFNDYINEKRVEKAKELLVSHPEITIEGVGYDAGFNSRASFYRAFKRFTNITPSEYLEQHKIA